MKKLRPIIARNAYQLAQALGLHHSEGAPIRLRSDLNSKIIRVVTQKKLTHAQVACLASTSRTRITAILNRNITDIATDLLLRTLYSLGYKTTIKFHRAP
jgi:predicted XRE-type DNA-binding protein